MIKSANLFFVLVLVAVLSVLFSAEAGAAPPPNMPLPPCEEMPGEGEGPSCQDSATGKLVSGSFEWRVSANQPLVVTTIPGVPKCSLWERSTNVWCPSPCYSKVSGADVAGCVVIDLQDGGTLKAVPCPTAFYFDSDARTSRELFDTRRLGDDDT